MDLATHYTVRGRYDEAFKFLEKAIRNKVGDSMIFRSDPLLKPLRNHPKFKEILTKSAARLFSEDLEIGFTLLYSFDTFYLIHQLLCEHFNSLVVNEDVLEKILNII